MISPSQFYERQRRFIAYALASPALSREKFLEYLNTGAIILSEISNDKISAAVESVLDTLDEKEKSVLDLKYCVVPEGSEHPHPYKQIGKMLGIRTPTVMRIKREAMTKLHPKLIEIINNS